MRYTVYEIIKELEETSGTNDKLAILEREKNNDLLKLVFRLALDPQIQFYTKRIPEVKTRRNQGTITFNTALKRLNKLSSRAVTGNAAQEYLEKLLECLMPDQREIIARIILKDMRCGVARGNVNKAWGKDFIPEFPCMLCQSYSEKNLEEIEYPAIIQEKCDGMRIAFIVRDGKVDVRSRNGKPLELLGAMDESILSIANGQNVVIDGELLVVDSKGNILPRKTGNGILQKANKGTIKKEEADRVRVVAWDIIPLSGWEKGFYKTMNYQQRFNYLRERIKATKNKKVSIPETEIVNNYSAAKAFYTRMLREGKEGAVLKNMNSPWENKRSRDQVKMKVENEVELVIVSKEEGTGKNVGKLGALVCESSDGLLRVNVGSGFSDEQRKDFWENDVLGKIITVKANAVIDAEGRKTKALFLPRFIEIREDKDEAETVLEIIEKFTH